MVSANPRRFFILSWLALLLGGSGWTVNGDIIIDGYTANTNDRFTNHPSFIGAGFNLSGVGQQSGTLAWATAISRNVVISAAHAFPATGNQINFYTGNDFSAPGALVTRTVISGVQVPGTDLYLATLDSNLPASIVHYSYATQDLTNAFPGTLQNAGIYQGLNAYMFGRSPEFDDNDPMQWIHSQAVGRNIITGYVENIPFNGNPNCDALIMFYESGGGPGSVQYEAYLQPGDSGGPMFVEISGQLVLLGTNAFINAGGLSGPPPLFSGVNYMGNQATFITNYINSVPEPSGLVMLGLLQVWWTLRRRR